MTQQLEQEQMPRVRRRWSPMRLFGILKWRTSETVLRFSEDKLAGRLYKFRVELSHVFRDCNLLAGMTLGDNKRLLLDPPVLEYAELFEEVIERIATDENALKSLVDSLYKVFDESLPCPVRRGDIPTQLGSPYDTVTRILKQSDENGFYYYFKRLRHGLNHLNKQAKHYKLIALLHFSGKNKIPIQPSDWPLAQQVLLTELLAQWRQIRAELDPERKWEAPVIFAQAQRAGTFSRLRKAALVAAFLMCSAISYGVYSLLHIPNIPPLNKGYYVGILPFTTDANVEEQGSQAYIGAGLSESLYAKWFGVPGLNVQLLDKNEEVRDDASIAAKRGVNVLVRGRVRVVLDTVRITVSAFDVVDKKALIAREFSGSRNDLLALEDKVSASFLYAVDRTISPGVSFRETQNPEAYDLYLRAREKMRTQQGVEDIRAAIELYRAAVEAESGFAFAYARLADAYLTLHRKTGLAEYLDAASDYAQRASNAGGERSPIVLMALGSAYADRGDIQRGIGFLERALRLTPASDEVRRRLGWAYMKGNRPSDAIRLFGEAIEINPHYWNNHYQLGLAYDAYGKYQKASSEFKKVIDLEPDDAVGYDSVGGIYLEQGRYSDSIEMFQKSLQLQLTAVGAETDVAYSNLGTAYYYTGDCGNARMMFDKAISNAPDNYTYIGNRADAYRCLGQEEEARRGYVEAIAMAERGHPPDRRDAETKDKLGLYYARSGNVERARSLIGEAVTADRENGVYIYDSALIEVVGRADDMALTLLARAFNNGASPIQAKADPELDPLRKRRGKEFDTLMEAAEQRSKQAGLGYRNWWDRVVELLKRFETWVRYR